MPNPGILKRLFGDKPKEAVAETDEVAALLEAYGYVPAGEGFYEPRRPSSERWRKVKGGWECYAAANASMGGGLPWGRAVMVDTAELDTEGRPIQIATGWMQVPFTQSENYRNVSGLHPAVNPEAFVWVWPDERLVEIYSHVAEPEGVGNQWIKAGDGTYTRRSARDSSMSLGV